MRVALGCVLALALLPAAASAATINVTTTTDESTDNATCSLREALEAANRDSNTHEDACTAGDPVTADTIVIPAGTYTLQGPNGEDNNATGDLDVVNYDPVASVPMGHENSGADVTFQGAGDGPTGAETIIDGMDNDRAIDVHSDAALSSIDVIVQDLTIRNGRATDGVGGMTEADDGAGIRGRDNNGNIRFFRGTIENSDADRWGGAISFANSSNGQGSPLMVHDSELVDNTAAGRGGAIYTDNAGSEGATQVYRSTLEGNDSTGATGGAIYVRGDNTSHLALVNSTITGGSAAGGGGAIGIGSGFAALQIVFSTIEGNSTTLTGGAGGIQTDNNSQVVNLYGSILSGNTAPSATPANCPRSHRGI